MTDMSPVFFFSFSFFVITSSMYPTGNRKREKGDRELVRERGKQDEEKEKRTTISIIAASKFIFFIYLLV